MFWKTRWTRPGGRLHSVWRSALASRASSASAHAHAQTTYKYSSAEELDSHEGVDLRDICCDLIELVDPHPRFRWVRQRRGSLRFCSTLVTGAAYIYRDKVDSLLRECHHLNMEMLGEASLRHDLSAQGRRWEDWEGTDDSDDDGNDDNDIIEEMRREPRHTQANSMSREETFTEIDIDVENRSRRKHSMSEMEYSTEEETNNCDDVEITRKDSDDSENTNEGITGDVTCEISEVSYENTSDRETSQEWVSLFDESTLITEGLRLPADVMIDQSLSPIISNPNQLKSPILPMLRKTRDSLPSSRKRTLSDVNEKSASQRSLTRQNISVISPKLQSEPEENHPPPSISREARFSLSVTDEPITIIFQHRFTDLIPGNDVEIPVHIASVPIKAGGLHISAHNIDNILIDSSQVGTMTCCEPGECTHRQIEIVVDESKNNFQELRETQREPKVSRSTCLVPCTSRGASNNLTPRNFNETQETTLDEVLENVEEITASEPISSAMTGTPPNDAQTPKALPPRSLPSGVRGFYTAPRSKTNRGTKTRRKDRDTPYRPPAHCVKAIHNQQPSTMSLRRRSSELNQSTTPFKRSKSVCAQTPQRPQEGINEDPATTDKVNPVASSSPSDTTKTISTGGETSLALRGRTSESNQRAETLSHTPQRSAVAILDDPASTDRFKPVAASSPSDITKISNPIGQVVPEARTTRQPVEFEFCAFHQDAISEQNLGACLAGTSSRELRPLEGRNVSSTTYSGDASPGESCGSNNKSTSPLINLQEQFQTSTTLRSDISSNQVTSTSPIMPCRLLAISTRRQVVSPDSTIPDDGLDEVANEDVDEVQTTEREVDVPVDSIKNNTNNLHDSLQKVRISTDQRKVSVSTAHSSGAEETMNDTLIVEESGDILCKDTSECDETSFIYSIEEEFDYENKEEDEIEDEQNMGFVEETNEAKGRNLPNTENYLSTIEERTEDDTQARFSIESEDINITVGNLAQENAINNKFIDSPLVKIGEVGRFSQSWKKHTLSDVEERCSSAARVTNVEEKGPKGGILNTEISLGLTTVGISNDTQYVNENDRSVLNENEEHDYNSGDEHETFHNLNPNVVITEIGDFSSSDNKVVTNASTTDLSSNSKEYVDKDIFVHIPPFGPNQRLENTLTFVGKMSDLRYAVRNALRQWFDSDDD